MTPADLRTAADAAYDRRCQTSDALAAAGAYRRDGTESRLSGPDRYARLAELGAAYDAAYAANQAAIQAWRAAEAAADAAEEG